MYAANAFLAAPSNQQCATRAIAKQLNISAAVAADEYAAATNPVSGESGSAAVKFNVSRQGLLNVIDVRGQFGGFAAIADGEGFDFVQAIEPGVGKMIDYSVRDEVVGVLGSWFDKLISQGGKLCDILGV
jgi:hypothetical protein